VCKKLVLVAFTLFLTANEAYSAIIASTTHIASSSFFGENYDLNFQVGIGPDYSTTNAYAFDVVILEANIGDSYFLHSGSQFDLFKGYLEDNLDHTIKYSSQFNGGGPFSYENESTTFPGVDFSNYDIDSFELIINDIFIFTEPDIRWYQGYRTDYSINATFQIHGTAVVPEPSTAWLLGPALLGLMRIKRKK